MADGYLTLHAEGSRQLSIFTAGLAASAKEFSMVSAAATHSLSKTSFRAETDAALSRQYTLQQQRLQLKEMTKQE